jgi:hypothetical protein
MPFVVSTECNVTDDERTPVKSSAYRLAKR